MVRVGRLPVKLRVFGALDAAACGVGRFLIWRPRKAATRPRPALQRQAGSRRKAGCAKPACKDGRSCRHPQQCFQRRHRPSQPPADSEWRDWTRPFVGMSEKRLGTPVQVIGGLRGRHRRPVNGLKRRENSSRWHSGISFLMVVQLNAREAIAKTRCGTISLSAKPSKRAQTTFKPRAAPTTCLMRSARLQAVSRRPCSSV